MKQTKFFDIEVPELGDRPDITQVSNAIEDLEDALAGTMELMDGEIQGNKLTLTSLSRNTKRTDYYDGLTIQFVAKAQINPNTVTLVTVDDLGEQTVSIPFLVRKNDCVCLTYKDSKFEAVTLVVQKDNSITSTSEDTVATSYAVKQVNDKITQTNNDKLDKGGYTGTAQNLKDSIDTKADKTVKVVAGKGLTGGGTLAGNVPLDIVSANSGITITEDGVQLMTVDSISSTDKVRPASANAVKLAYDKGKEGLDEAKTKLTNQGIHTSFGNRETAISTNEFIEILKSKGAFIEAYWVSRGSWSYADNHYINDTGLEDIHLAGAVVEVFGDTNVHTIRITTSTTSARGGQNSEFIYVNNGADYAPGWRKLWNNKNFDPNSKLNISGGYINKLLVGNTVWKDANITLAIGDSDTGFNWSKDGEFYTYANNTPTIRYNGWETEFLTELRLNKKVSSKGYADSYSSSARSKTAFQVGNGAGGALPTPGNGVSTFTKGYQIETYAQGLGYYSRSCFGHLRTGHSDWGETVLFFEGDQPNQNAKYWRFDHNGGDFKLDGYIYERGKRVVNHYDVNQQALIWTGSAYSVDFTLPNGTWDDFLYVGCAGNNQAGVLDCNMINQLPIGRGILVGYGQGGNVDHACTFVKTGNNTGRFVQQGSGSTGGYEQTFTIQYIFARRFKF